MVDFVDLAALKDDLGITGTADDAWLQRRVDGALAAFANWTHRYIGPLSTFEDDFGKIVDVRSLDAFPPPSFDVSIPPILNVTPVTEIVTAANKDGPLDVTKVVFDGVTGGILTLDGTVQSQNPLAARIRSDAVVIRYRAGWDQLPGDLFEALVSIVANRYSIRAAERAGMTAGGLGLRRISVPDVGDVQFNPNSANIFEAMTATKSHDPLLGPWANVLNSYIKVVVGDVWAPFTKWISTP